MQDGVQRVESTDRHCDDSSVFGNPFAIKRLELSTELRGAARCT